MKSTNILAYFLISVSQINTARASYFSWISKLSIDCCPAKNSSDTPYPFFCRICHQNEPETTNVTTNTTCPSVLIFESWFDDLSAKDKGEEPDSTSPHKSSSFSHTSTLKALPASGHPNKYERGSISEPENRHFDNWQLFESNSNDQDVDDRAEYHPADYFGHKEPNEQADPEFDDIFMEVARNVPQKTRNQPPDMFDYMRVFANTYMGSPLTVQRMVKRKQHQN